LVEIEKKKLSEIVFDDKKQHRWVRTKAFFTQIGMLFLSLVILACVVFICAIGLAIVGEMFNSL